MPIHQSLGKSASYSCEDNGFTVVASANVVEASAEAIVRYATDILAVVGRRGELSPFSVMTSKAWPSTAKDWAACCMTICRGIFLIDYISLPNISQNGGGSFAVASSASQN